MTDTAAPGIDREPSGASTPDELTCLAQAVAGIAKIIPQAPQGLLEPRLRTPLFAGFVALAMGTHAAGLATYVLSGRDEGNGGRFAQASGLTAIDTEIIDSHDVPNPGGRIEEASPGAAGPPGIASIDQAPSQVQPDAAASMAATLPPLSAPPLPFRDELTSETDAEVQVAVQIPAPSFALDPTVAPQIDPAKVPEQREAADRPAELASVEPATTAPSEPAPQQDASQASSPGEEGTAQAVKDTSGNGGLPAATPGQIKTYHSRLGAHIRANRPISRGRWGKVVVNFGLGPDGALQFANVVQSSGNAQLEAKTLAAIHKAAPFPKPPAGMHGKQLEFTVPFSFYQ